MLGRFLQKLGLVPLFLIGLLVSLLLFAIGGVSFYFRDVVEQQTVIFAGQIDQQLQSINQTLKFTIDLILDTEQNVVIVANEIPGRIAMQIASLETFLMTLSNNPSQPQQELQTQINALINGLRELKTTYENVVLQSVQDTKVFLDGLFSPTGIVTRVINLLKGAQQLTNLASEPDSVIYQTYNTVAIILLVFGASIFGLLFVGFVWRKIFYVKIDGVYFKRSNLKNNLRQHLQKLVAKKPELAMVVDQYRKRF